jgi:hypothetical protein
MIPGFEILHRNAPAVEGGRRSYGHLFVVAAPPRVMSVMVRASGPQEFIDTCSSSLKTFMSSMRFGAASHHSAGHTSRPAP